MAEAAELEEVGGVARPAKDGGAAWLPWRRRRGRPLGHFQTTAFLGQLLPRIPKWILVWITRLAHVRA
jgi:hypothetical protein